MRKSINIFDLRLGKKGRIKKFGDRDTAARRASQLRDRFLCSINSISLLATASLNQITPCLYKV